MSLTLDFIEFFIALHQREPFPWQAQLAEEVCRTGVWPRDLQLPTGSGKTAVIDIAVFHLAHEASKGSLRCAPLRIFFVVDRRIVVDSAFDRARSIAGKLSSPDPPAGLKPVAFELSKLSGDPLHPLKVARLRGGVPRENDWASSISQPLLCVSTIDQVGSRLLFRGYGLSSRMWPIHAGLVGSDALWFLDEAHLAQPLLSTLSAIAGGHPDSTDKSWQFADMSRLAPFASVQLSATINAGSHAAFHLSPADLAHATLGPRITATKTATAILVNGIADLEAEAAALAKKFLDQRHPKSVLPPAAIAIIVNRVDRARTIHTTLAADPPLGGDSAEPADVVLLTGRSRPLERDRILANVLPAIGAGRHREPGAKPVLVVATQTLEVGADLDFDALITEIAPLDNLRQRFGRLDRMGERRESHAWILADRAAVAKNAEDPIYGAALSDTWAWLVAEGASQPGLDFGTAGLAPRLNALAPSRLAAMIAPRPSAPTLLPPYLDLWAATSPPSSVTPEPSLFLHGPDRAGAVDVALVWRADITPQTDAAAANASLAACPPSAAEALALPFWIAKRWLACTLTPDAKAAVADVTAPAGAADADLPPTTNLRSAWRWDDDAESWLLVAPDQLRPGDTLVLPSSYGGCDRWGWNPMCSADVADMGDQVLDGRRVLRIHRTLLEQALSAENRSNDAEPLWRRIRATLQIASDDNNDAPLLVESLSGMPLPLAWQTALADLASAARSLLKLTWYDEDDAGAGALLDAATSRPESSFTGVAVALDDHLRAVAEATAEDAANAGIPPSLVGILRAAALAHDCGKADPRFQAMLRGSPWGPSGLPLLAKSAHGMRSRPVQSVPVPKGFRHEALSVVLAANHPDWSLWNQADLDLLLWLVGTHHGYGRPFFPGCADPDPKTPVSVALAGVTLSAHAGDSPTTLGDGWIERAARVRRRFGPWELARLEAAIRLADHRVSARESGPYVGAGA